MQPPSVLTRSSPLGPALLRTGLLAPAQVLLHSHLFLTACALALTAATEVLITGVVPPLYTPLHGLVAAGTLISYNVHVLYNHGWSGRASWWKYSGALNIAMTALATLLLAVSATGLKSRTVVFCAVLAVVAAAYSTPLLPFRFKQRLKDHGIAKIITLAGVWMLVTVGLPAVELNAPLSTVWPEAVGRILILLPVCIAFDIRDYQADAAAQIMTLPTRIGVSRAYGVAYTLLALFAGWEIFRAWPALSLSEAGSVGVAVAGAALIRLSAVRSNEYTYMLGVDGVLLLYGLKCLCLG